MDTRKIALEKWLFGVLGGFEGELIPLVLDASFRRYFRLEHEGQRYVAMDAPPGLETCELEPFVGVAKAFLDLGLQVPEIFHEDILSGFLLISDFGDRLYFKELNEQSADTLYKRAIDDLLVIQSCENIPGLLLESFNDKLLMWELEQFRHWLLKAYLGLNLSPLEEKMLDNTFNLLLQSACAQPQVCIHRDYHSRNLMVLESGHVGILDFQDAMSGPITYDLVSLLRDCYVAWPHESVEHWVTYYYEKASAKGFLNDMSRQTFGRFFDWMGMQRHLKASFIFARKWLRDSHLSI